MTLWRITYDSRQMQCCGEPFSVGDEVRWPPALREPDEVTAPESWEENFSRLDRVAGSALLSGPGVTALYAGELDPSGTRPVGLLAVERHGPGPDDVPDTVGSTVRSIQVVTEGYAETHAGSRTYEPVAGERWLREVDTCPKWFSGARPDRRGRGYRRVETGALVGLETPGGPVAARPGE